MKTNDDKPAFALPMAGDQYQERMNPFFVPTKLTLRVLNEKEWMASYSGGKDSTSLVTWIEWLRRSGMVKVARPRAIQSDTEAEFPFLTEVVEMMISTLRACGWDITIVRPAVDKKLYNSIFGLGQTPVNPAFKGMRWCTRQTKIGPMDKWKKENTEKGVVALTGVRWGESKVRDEKIKARGKVEGGCGAGGECGLPPVKEGQDVYGPILNWHDTHVVKWLAGTNECEVTNGIMSDLRGVTARLLRVYHTSLGDEGLGLFPRKVHFLRFGCCGCPALKRDKVIRAAEKEDPSVSALKALYALWDECRLKYNRMWHWNEKKGKLQYGPVKIAVRKKLFEKFLAIQERAGVKLVGKQDIKFIEWCWKKNKHPGKNPDKWQDGPVPEEYQK